MHYSLLLPSSSDESKDKVQEVQLPKGEQQLQNAQKKTGVLTSVSNLQFLIKNIENKKKTTTKIFSARVVQEHIVYILHLEFYQYTVENKKVPKSEV